MSAKGKPMRRILPSCAFAMAVFVFDFGSLASAKNFAAVGDAAALPRVEKPLGPHEDSALMAQSPGAKNDDLRECGYRNLTFGPIFEISSSETVSLSPGQTFILIQDKSDDVFQIHFLGNGVTKKFHKKTGESVSIIDDREVGIDEGGSFIAQNVLSGVTRRTTPPETIGNSVISEQNIELNNRRILSIMRLYANNRVLKLSPNDIEAYEHFRLDVLSGSYCGIRISNLTPSRKRSLKPMIRFLVWDALSVGALDDYQSWQKYRNVIGSFFSTKELGSIFEVYGYRSAEAAASDPELSRIDPDRVWVFAWSAIADIFKHKDFVRFTDVSSYQRNGSITFILLGTDKLDGVAVNKFGFYYRYLATVNVNDVTDKQHFEWAWTHGGAQYKATLVLDAAVSKSDVKMASFPGNMHNGLIVLDKTLTNKNVKDGIDEYLRYFRREGFKFESRMRVRNVQSYLMARFLSKPRLDYLIREGHADSDDDNLMTIHDKGFVIKGTRVVNELAENISIVFNIAKKSKEQRIDYDEFTSWVERWYGDAHKPFIFLNTSCWGIEKAWVSLSRSSSSRLVEVAARTPVNYFTHFQPDATGILISGIRHGETFESIRSKLRSLGDYSSGYEDNFVLPDEKEYPQMAPIVKIHRSLSVRKGSGKARRYTPNGYI